MSLSWSKTRLVGPEDVPPSGAEFQVVGAFNPAAVSFNGGVVLLVRVAQLLVEESEGEFLLPRHEPGRGYVVDRFPTGEIDPRDRRVVQVRATGAARLTSVSHLRVVYCGDGRRVERLGAALHPEAEYEEFGMEDPRITPIGGRFYITYVAVSRHGAATALASTADFQTFERHGLIFPPENKDVMLFPEQIGGQYFALHRPVCAIPFTGPEMWLARSPDLVHWGGHTPLYRGNMAWESGRVGGGAPPVRTERGWLALYHGNIRPTRIGQVGAYCAGAMLLDGDDPSRILQVASAPVMEPTETYEREGFVPDVVFPTGVVEREGRLLVYYGAADACTAVGEIAWEELWKAFD
jgi:beta-1,2-mannobiose phosphorylase / 1,2-beta-oligomannan phosphorylase